MNTKTQRGDVAILIVTMMVLIMSFIVITASEKTFRDVGIGRKGIGSQQAVQAANVGIEVWFMQLRDGSTNDIPRTQVSDLPSEVTVYYEVTYDEIERRLVSRGYAQVVGGSSDEVVRVLEVQL